ncbi:hypothetical protein [Streptomyces virginiae]|uniref:hypothetical protein n=1 Tax=Streptomyces virginiae TaxID=1961 RepID=UPI002254469C|nr:hypothetical protein [Streptomyces virginiae]MCX5174444.1 hypothetical protein [Streptomyces virginiae]
MSPLDRTVRRRPVTGEAQKAARRGLAETARESLQHTVRTAAALAEGVVAGHRGRDGPPRRPGH